MFNSPLVPYQGRPVTDVYSEKVIAPSSPNRGDALPVPITMKTSLHYEGPLDVKKPKREVRPTGDKRRLDTMG